jgi:hypothetical protein
LGVGLWRNDRYDTLDFCGDNCDFEFTHSMIEDSGVTNFFGAAETGFLDGGAELECPNCGRKDSYRRHEPACQN